MDEISQTVVSDSDLAGDDLSDASGSTAAAAPSKSPALTRKKQHPTYKGSLDLCSLGTEFSLCLSIWHNKATVGPACPLGGRSTQSWPVVGAGLWEGGRYQHADFSLAMCVVSTILGAPVMSQIHNSCFSWVFK